MDQQLRSDTVELLTLFTELKDYCMRYAFIGLKSTLLHNSDITIMMKDTYINDQNRYSENNNEDDDVIRKSENDIKDLVNKINSIFDKYGQFDTDIPKNLKPIYKIPNQIYETVGLIKNHKNLYKCLELCSILEDTGTKLNESINKVFNDLEENE